MLRFSRIMGLLPVSLLLASGATVAFAAENSNITRTTIPLQGSFSFPAGDSPQAQYLGITDPNTEVHVTQQGTLEVTGYTSGPQAGKIRVQYNGTGMTAVPSINASGSFTEHQVAWGFGDPSDPNNLPKVSMDINHTTVTLADGSTVKFMMHEHLNLTNNQLVKDDFHFNCV
ncbi:MAG TPA: hypothetical protein VH186_09080 [Chloroflexia bacterium]|nr:hypothetical protein [Chloroflexia bacterium]